MKVLALVLLVLLSGCSQSKVTGPEMVRAINEDRQSITTLANSMLALLTRVQQVEKKVGIKVEDPVLWPAEKKQ